MDLKLEEFVRDIKNIMLEKSDVSLTSLMKANDTRPAYQSKDLERTRKLEIDRRLLCS